MAKPRENFKIWANQNSSGLVKTGKNQFSLARMDNEE